MSPTPTTETATTEAPRRPDMHAPPGDRSAEVPTGRSRLRAIDWRPILLEAFFVVLGVVLALAANEWRQGVADRRAAVTALASIRQELTRNRQLVLDAAAYHLHLTDTIAAIRRSGSGDAARLPDVRVFARGYVRPATLLSTAWETAATTDVVRHMAHEDVLLLAGIYEQQRRYAAQADRIGDLIYGEIFARGTVGVVRNYANLGSIIAALSFRECELLVGYDQTLATLHGRATPTAAALPERCRRMTRR